MTEIFGWVRDGYLIAAAQDPEAQEWPYWELVDPVENGDELVSVSVPEAEVQKFLDHGTSDQFYGDGYEAYDALRELGESFEVIDTAKDFEDYNQSESRVLEMGSMGDPVKRNQLRVLKQKLRMPDEMVGVAGGPNKEQAREILRAKFGYTDKMIAKLEEERLPSDDFQDGWMDSEQGFEPKQRNNPRYMMGFNAEKAKHDPKKYTIGKGGSSWLQGRDGSSKGVRQKEEYLPEK